MTLGHLAALDTDLRLGTLVSPVTLHHAGVLAKQAATLDVISGGRAFCGVGAGWFEREHLGYGLPFPPAGTAGHAGHDHRDDASAVGSGHETVCGSTGFAARDHLRPVGDLPVLVGGSGARTLRIAGALGDACNVSSDEALLQAGLPRSAEPRNGRGGTPTTSP